MEAIKRKPTPAYLKRVRRFPLVPIEDDQHLAEAQSVIDKLLQENLDAEEQKYLDVLSDLVAAYEEEHHPMPEVSGADMLRHLIEARDITQTQLASETGIAPSTISSILKGNREMRKEHIAKLSEFFGVTPNLFF
jgi:HTH-type transcriptional regulator/antitoxin HigA